MTNTSLRGIINMVIVAQLVRAPDCGSGGCGFEPRLSPPDTSIVLVVARWSPKPKGRVRIFVGVLIEMSR